MGLLPVIAEGVDVSIPTAGLLVSAYAVGVMIGAPVMTLVFARFGRRAALMSLMAIFTVGNILSALSPDYWTLLFSRLVTSLNHGAFFGLGAVVAASVVPKDKQASAVATMFMGPDHRQYRRGARRDMAGSADRLAYGFCRHRAAGRNRHYRPVDGFAER